MVSYKTDRLQKSIEQEMNRLNEKYDSLTPDLKKQADYLNNVRNVFKIDSI